MRHNVAPIFICPPNADDTLLRQIASYGRGYTYLLSRAGVTGAENKAALPLHHLVEKLAEYHAAPPLQGFGISSPDQVTAAIDAKAAGAISGSAIVKIIEKNVDKPEQMLAELKAFVTAMKAATRKADPSTVWHPARRLPFLPRLQQRITSKLILSIFSV
jgi:tryptophan synthase alpha chain